MEERLSINSKSLKKYGSTTSRNNTRNETYINHNVSKTDTLQGIALKYGVTMEQIRRANRLWASDSLFLRENLLIPVPLDNNSSSLSSPTSPQQQPPSTSSSQSSQLNNSSLSSYDNEDLNEFLFKIDAAIANTKEEVKKVQGNSDFVSSCDFTPTERRKPAVSRMKKFVNNNESNDYLTTPQAIVMSQNTRVRTSLKKNEKLQEDLFEL